MFNDYWWSSGTGGRRGIKWLPWSNISMSKHKGRLGFESLWGFKIYLMGKHCWNLVQNPNALVSRLYKESYFSDSYPLRAAKCHDPSFIWSGIWSTKEALISGFRWIVGEIKDIVVVKDPWLRRKKWFHVEKSHIYEGRNKFISDFFYPNSKKWDINLV